MADKFENYGLKFNRLLTCSIHLSFQDLSVSLYWWSILILKIILLWYFYFMWLPIVYCNCGFFDVFQFKLKRMEQEKDLLSNQNSHLTAELNAKADELSSMKKNKVLSVC